jgi:hypothetical protein
MPRIVTEGGIVAAGIALLFAVLFTTEIGFRLGKGRARRLDRGSAASPSTGGSLREQATAVQAATLGLLALLLGFALAMADARFAARRELTIEEVNAIGTTYLRAGFLPDGHAVETRALLRRYVGVRRDYFAARSGAQIADAERRGAAIHRALWIEMEAAADEHPGSPLLAAYAAALNQLIDLDAKRLVALENHVPHTIVGLLLVVALVAAGTTGYACGLGDLRSTLSLFVMPTLIAIACAVVVDLDRPRIGTIRDSDRSMDRLQQTLDAHQGP